MADDIVAVQADPEGVLERFRVDGRLPFSFGAGGRAEAVMLSYDEFAALDGHEKFEVPGFTDPESIREHLAAELGDMLSGVLEPVPIVWGGERPEAVAMTAAHYRRLRGDDEPPPGVDDDPTVRNYDRDAIAHLWAVVVEALADLASGRSDGRHRLGFQPGRGDLRDCVTAYLRPEPSEPAAFWLVFREIRPGRSAADGPARELISFTEAPPEPQPVAR